MAKQKTKNHTCRAIIVTCMDFRLDKDLARWTMNNFNNSLFDRLAIAGASKNLPFVLNQIELSYTLHHIDEVYLIHHEDCGAYGKSGNFKKHKKDMHFAKKMIKQQHPDLKVILLYQTLAGEFIEVEKQKVLYLNQNGKYIDPENEKDNKK